MYKSDWRLDIDGMCFITDSISNDRGRCEADVAAMKLIKQYLEHESRYQAEEDLPIEGKLVKLTTGETYMVKATVDIEVEVEFKIHEMSCTPLGKVMA